MGLFCLYCWSKVPEFFETVAQNSRLGLIVRLSGLRASHGFRPRWGAAIEGVRGAMKNLDRQMSIIVVRLLERGFEFPFVATLVGSAGNVVVIRLDDAEKSGFRTSVLAEDTRGSDLELPVTVTITDRRGETSTIVIRAYEGDPEVLR